MFINLLYLNIVFPKDCILNTHLIEEIEESVHKSLVIRAEQKRFFGNDLDSFVGVELSPAISEKAL